METIKLTIVQQDIIWENVQANLENYDILLNSIEETDLILFPEMFASGFTMNTSLWNESSNNMIHQWLEKSSLKKKCGIMASTGYFENDSYYNRLYLIEGTKRQFYNKRHLFGPGKENSHYAKGIERKTFDYKSWKILPQICYDLRFPVWSRNDLNYDIIIYLANWPASRKNHWDTLLKARSIENQSFTIGVNRIGNDGNQIDYSGNSVGFDFKGDNILKMANNMVDIKTITLHKQSMYEYRQKLNFLADMDRFEIK